MPAILELDPFTVAYNGLVDLLKDNAGLQAVAPRWAHNVRSLNANHGQDVVREVVKEADLPELLIEAKTIGGNLNLSSCSAEVNRAYRLSVAGGTGPIGSKLFLLEWAIYCALVDSNYTAVLRDLTWRGEKFVVNTTLDSVQSGEADVNPRGIHGWVALWEITLRMVFPKQLIRDFSAGVGIVVD